MSSDRRLKRAAEAAKAKADRKDRREREKKAEDVVTVAAHKAGSLVPALYMLAAGALRR